MFIFGIVTFSIRFRLALSRYSRWSTVGRISDWDRAPIVARWADRFSRCRWPRFSRFLTCPLILPLPRGEYPQCLQVIVYLCSTPLLLPIRY